jgi:hypothetical protein
MPTKWGAAPLPNPVLGAAARAYEPETRAASAPGRQPPVRRRGRGASPGAGRGHRPPNPAAQGPSWTPRTTPRPDQLPPGPRGRTVANIAASGPSDRAAGPGLNTATSSRQYMRYKHHARQAPNTRPHARPRPPATTTGPGSTSTASLRPPAAS